MYNQLTVTTFFRQLMGVGLCSNHTAVAFDSMNFHAMEGLKSVGLYLTALNRVLGTTAVIEDIGAALWVTESPDGTYICTNLAKVYTKTRKYTRSAYVVTEGRLAHELNTFGLPPKGVTIQLPNSSGCQGKFSVPVQIRDTNLVAWADVDCTGSNPEVMHVTMSNNLTQNSDSVARAILALLAPKMAHAIRTSQSGNYTKVSILLMLQHLGYERYLNMGHAVRQTVEAIVSELSLELPAKVHFKLDGTDVSWKVMP